MNRDRGRYPVTVMALVWLLGVGLGIGFWVGFAYLIAYFVKAF